MKIAKLVKAVGSLLMGLLMMLFVTTTKQRTDDEEDSGEGR